MIYKPTGEKVTIMTIHGDRIIVKFEDGSTTVCGWENLEEL